MKYVLMLRRADTISPILSRVVDLPCVDLKAEELAVAKRAMELYRDAAHARGLWPQRTKPE